MRSPRHYRGYYSFNWRQVVEICCNFCGKEINAICTLRRGPEERIAVYRSYCICCGSNLNTSYKWTPNDELEEE